MRPEYASLLFPGRQHLELQALPISNPDPIPKKVFLKKKNHGKADARALTGAEIAEREHQARDAALAASTARKDRDATPPSTPLAAGESPYRTTTTLPIRPSPRRAPQATHFTLFPRDDTPEAPSELPPSTAPPRLEQPEEQAQGRGKRRKVTKKPFEYSTPR
jgi:hypothetical protein